MQKVEVKGQSVEKYTMETNGHTDGADCITLCAKVFRKNVARNTFADKTIIFWHLCQGHPHANGIQACHRTPQSVFTCTQSQHVAMLVQPTDVNHVTKRLKRNITSHHQHRFTDIV